MYGECAQAVVKVFPQSTVGNGLFNVDLGGSQYPNIHLDAALATQSDKMSVAQDLQ